MQAISPFYHVDKVRAPLIIGQGANDVRVPQKQSDKMYQAMKARGLDVTYVLYSGEHQLGHTSGCAVPRCTACCCAGFTRYKPPKQHFMSSLANTTCRHSKPDCWSMQLPGVYVFG